MKKIVYFIIPIGAFFIILINAFFGHLIFDFSGEQDINKYSIYLHFLPDWNSYPSNLVFDVTTVWDKPDSSSESNSYYEPEISNKMITEYNSNQLYTINGKQFVELQHEFSSCENIWKPILYRQVLDTVTHQIDNLVGNQINSDPYVVNYPQIPNSNYNSELQKSKLKNGFSRFIPICTGKENTSYDFSIKINDDKIGFDVFFVPNIEEQKNYHQNFKDFTFYTDEGCSGQNFQKFSGICRNVGKQSGLLITIPDELSFSLTKITVNLHELE